MFSKKKNELLMEPDYEEGRTFFRVEPSGEETIDISIGVNKYQIDNIGAGGIGFDRGVSEELEEGKEYPFKMALPLINEVISGIISVVDISDKGFQCSFVDLSTEQMEKIHLFALELQKKEKRTFSRIRPSCKDPINFSIGPKTYQIKDVGSGGMGVYRRGDKELEIGKEYPFKMPLSLINEVISGFLRIVDISNKAYQCAFVDLSKEQIEKIHLFVFEMQKEETWVFFRVEPSVQEPINISIGSKAYQIKDIGAGGISFFHEGEGKKLEIEKEYPFKMKLPLVNDEILGIIRIVNISDASYHCAFVDRTQDDTEKIHLFVLERQKQELKEKNRKKIFH